MKYWTEFFFQIWSSNWWFWQKDNCHPMNTFLKLILKWPIRGFKQISQSVASVYIWNATNKLINVMLMMISKWHTFCARQLFPPKRLLLFYPSTIPSLRLHQRPNDTNHLALAVSVYTHVKTLNPHKKMKDRVVSFKCEPDAYTYLADGLTSY